MSSLAIKTNCVWALSNLAGSSLDVRDRILDNDDVIFHRLGRCIDQALATSGQRASQRLIGEIVTFIKTMVMHENINESQYTRSFLSAFLLVCQALDRVEFNVNERRNLSRDAEHHLHDIVQCLTYFSELEIIPCVDETS